MIEKEEGQRENGESGGERNRGVQPYCLIGGGFYYSSF